MMVRLEIREQTQVSIFPIRCSQEVQQCFSRPPSLCLYIVMPSEIFDLLSLLEECFANIKSPVIKKFCSLYVLIHHDTT